MVKRARTLAKVLRARMLASVVLHAIYAPHVGSVQRAMSRLYGKLQKTDAALLDEGGRAQLKKDVATLAKYYKAQVYNGRGAKMLLSLQQLPLVVALGGFEETCEFVDKQ